MYGMGWGGELNWGNDMKDKDKGLALYSFTSPIRILPHDLLCKPPMNGLPQDRRENIQVQLNSPNILLQFVDEAAGMEASKGGRASEKTDD